MIINLLIFFIIGCVSLLLLTFIVYRTGMVHKTRDSSGQLKNKQSITGIIIIAAVAVLIMSFFVLFGMFSFKKHSGFPEKVLWISILMSALVLFDSFFIDLLVIGTIKPSFLHIPIETNLKTMKEHVKKTFTFGLTIIVPIIIISAGIVQIIQVII